MSDSSDGVNLFTMTGDDDMNLVAEYARSRSGQAFSTLVSRHVNLVYSVALRQVGDPHLAEEVTQGAFIILTQKAGRLDRKTILSGWLCRTARNVAFNALTMQRRRIQREQEAYMQSMTERDASDDIWAQVSPFLETALSELGEKAHDAIVLRFLEGRSLAEVGAAVGTSENTATKRVNRAVDKLRTIFRKRNVTLSSAVLCGLISTKAVHAVPPELVSNLLQRLQRLKFLQQPLMRSTIEDKSSPSLEKERNIARVCSHREFSLLLYPLPPKLASLQPRQTSRRPHRLTFSLSNVDRMAPFNLFSVAIPRRTTSSKRRPT